MIGPPRLHHLALTAGELLAILAVLRVRLGKDHPLTRRVQALQAHTQPEGETT